MVWRQLNLFNLGQSVEQFAEADLLLVMSFCRRMVYGKAKRFSVEQKAMPAVAGGLAPPFYTPILPNELNELIES